MKSLLFKQCISTPNFQIINLRSFFLFFLHQFVSSWSTQTSKYVSNEPEYPACVISLRITLWALLNSKALTVFSNVNAIYLYQQSKFLHSFLFWVTETLKEPWVTASDSVCHPSARCTCHLKDQLKSSQYSHFNRRLWFCKSARESIFSLMLSHCRPATEVSFRALVTSSTQISAMCSSHSSWTTLLAFLQSPSAQHKHWQKE